MQNKLKICIKNPIVVILCIALLSRLVYFAVLCTTKGYVGFTDFDTPSYLIEAKSFLSSFSFINGEHYTLRTPGYPLYIAFMMVVLGQKLFWIGVVLGQIALNVLGVYLLYKTVRLMGFDKRIGCISALLMALSPLDIKCCNSVLSDCITQFTLILSLYFFVKYLKNLNQSSNLKNYIFACISMAVALLIRPSVMFLPFCIALGITFVHILFHRDWKKILCIVLATVAICLSPILLWCDRNHKISGYYTYTSVSAINTYAWNSAYVYAEQNNMSYYDAYTILWNDIKDIDNSNAPLYRDFAQKGKQVIISAPGTYAKGCIKGAVCLAIYPGMNDFLSAFGNSISNVTDTLKQQLFGNGLSVSGILSSLFSNPGNILILSLIAVDVLLLLIIWVLGIYGMAVFFKTHLKEWYIPALLLGIMAYMIFVHMQPVGIGAYPRFRFIYECIGFIFSSVGAVSFIEATKNKRLNKTKTTIHENRKELQHEIY